MKIKNTSHDAQKPWPVDVFIQGGSSGLVFRPVSKGGNYETAFVEVHHDTCGFIRGEGPTVPEAEEAAWAKYVRTTSCPGHEYEARSYRNGAGFCKHCGRFASKVFTPEQLGCFCKVCGVPSFWERVGDDFFCEGHACTPEVRALRRERLRAVYGTEKTVTGSKLGDFFAKLEDEMDDDD